MGAYSILVGSPERRLQAKLMLALAGITLAVFAGVCGNGFVQYDDSQNIYSNPHVMGLGWEQITWMFTNTQFARRYMPLGWLSYAVDYQFFGPNPHVYHLGNLLLHLVNVMLVFLVLKRLVRLADGPGQDQAGSSAELWCAAVGALFWAVNPLRTEPVAWAAARIYCLAFLLAMVWLLMWLRSQESGITKRQRAIFYGLSVLAYTASLLTYPLALFAPAVLFVLEVYPLRRVGRRISDWWRPEALEVWRDKIPFLIVGGGMLVTSLLVRTETNFAYRPTTLQEFSLGSRIMQAFYIWAYYAWKPWAPYDLAVCYPTLHSFNPLGAEFIVSATVVLGASVLFGAMRRRWPGAFALWLCHLAVLIPVLGLTEYPHSACDRYSYLHGVLWSVAIAGLLRAVWRRGRQAYLAGSVALGASLLFALLAWQQVSAWRDPIMFYRHTIAREREHPHRARFDEMLGVDYLRCGLTNEAVASFQNAVRFESRRQDRNIYGGGVLARLHQRLADIFASRGETDEALKEYVSASELEPNSTELLMKIAGTLDRLNRDSESIPYFQAVLRVKPQDRNARHHLGLILEKLGKREEAREQFEEERRLSVKE
jgi:protein O-mannosyl-transferase